MKLRIFPSAVILCAAAFAVTALLTHVLQRHDTQFPFRGVEIMPADAEIHYVARMREVYDGFWTGNTFYSEPKDQPYLQPPFPEMIPATVAKWTHQDPVLTFMAFLGLSAFVLVIVMTGAMTALTGAAWESLLAVCALVFAGFLLGAPWDFGKFLAGAGAFEPLRFTRPINPLWTVPWFFAVIWLTAEWLRGRRRALMLCVVPLTVLVYSYVYAWSYLAVTLALLTLWFGLKRDWRKVLDLCLCGILVGLMSVPYVLHLLETMRHPFYADSALRLGLISSHAPVLGVWMAIGLIVVAATYKRWGATWPLVAALIIGGIAAMNQQIITGKFIVPNHYHWYFLHPLASMLSIVLVLQVAGSFLSAGWKRCAVAALLCVAVVFGLRYQELSYVSTRSYWGEQQTLAPVLQYIDQHMHAGQVVYSPDIDVMDFVPIYTSVDVYTSTNANNYLVSIDRARTVFFFDLWVNGYTAEQAEKEFPTTKRAQLGSALYAIYFRERYGSYDAVPADVVAENVAAYRTFLALPDTQKIALYPITAVVLPDDVKETPAISLLKSMSDQVFASEGFTVRMMKSR